MTQQKLRIQLKQILSEAETVGKNSNTVVTEATALAVATEKMKNELEELISTPNKVA